MDAIGTSLKDLLLASGHVTQDDVDRVGRQRRAAEWQQQRARESQVHHARQTRQTFLRQLECTREQKALDQALLLIALADRVERKP
jgi:hypothetical protein